MPIEIKNAASESNISQENIDLILSLDDKELPKAMRRIEDIQRCNAIVERNIKIEERNQQLGEGEDREESEEEETSDPEARDYFVSAPASDIIDDANEAGLQVLTKAIKLERKRRVEATASTDISDTLQATK